MNAAQRELILVRKLCFVAQVDLLQRNKTVIIRLAPPIIQYLPQERWSIQLRQDEFTAANVVKAYKKVVVEHLTQGLTLAEQLLEDASLLKL